MTETVGKEIMLEGVDPRELYGAQDVYLEQIKSLHPTLKIVARGQSLKVLGPEADTQRFAKRMEGLFRSMSSTATSRPRSSNSVSRAASRRTTPRSTRT